MAHDIYYTIYKNKRISESKEELRKLLILVNSNPNDQQLGSEIRKINLSLIKELVDEDPSFS